VDNTHTVTDTWTYWPYGEVQSRGGSSITPFTFLGTLGYFVDFLNQLYVRARHLRADLTRWATTDPSWPLKRSYSYADSMPSRLTDASGMFPSSVFVCLLLRTTDCEALCGKLCPLFADAWGITDLGGLYAGFNFCANGCKCGCVNPGTLAKYRLNPILRNCTYVHEHAHIDPADCPPHWYGAPKGTQGSDCDAYQNEALCLYNACVGLTSGNCADANAERKAICDNIRGMPDCHPSSWWMNLICP